LTIRRLLQAVLLLALALVGGLSGCSARQNGSAIAPSANSGTLNPVSASGIDSQSGQQRLEALWQKRTSDNFGADFKLGPGDLLEISVPLEQLQHREVRVSSQDAITLPLAGVVSVKGMTEQNLIDDLHQRLSKYMYDPPISLFVSHYGSREVAVMGAVAKPDLYTLESGSDTLMGMISKAGGMTSDASGKLIFVPGGQDGTVIGPGNPVNLTQMRGSSTGSGTRSTEVPHGLGAESPAGSGGPIRSETAIEPERNGPTRPDLVNTAYHPNQSLPSGPALTRMHPIIIWMNDPAMQNYVELPARPGDLLIVPAAGQVTVGGWVQSPGGFNITTGMTALSAISAAGGALFSTSAQVLRTSSDGERSSIPFSISRVQKGEEADVPVQSGDVVLVDRSAAGAVPYFVYTLFSHFGTGIGIPIP
jgi:protein involved in polysaccharide export with SLBB domain